MKYSFECSCGLVFTRNLKIGDYSTYPCPSCSGTAKRVFEAFGFGFSAGKGSPGNSGVSKHDYPTADYAVGRDAESRWQEIRARDQVKEEVRRVNGSRALVRRNGPKNQFVEYGGASQELLEHRRATSRAVEKAVKSGRVEE